MTEAQAIEAISARFIADWAAVQPSVPCMLEGEIGDSSSTWIRMTVRHSLSSQVTLGSPRRFERLGSVFVQIFAPVNAGRVTLATLADSVRTVIEGQTLAVGDDCLHLYAGRTEHVPTDGVYVMSVVVVPFRYYEHRT